MLTIEAARSLPHGRKAPVWAVAALGLLLGACGKSPSVDGTTWTAVDVTATATVGQPVTIDVVADNQPDAGSTLSLTALGTPKYGAATIVGNKVSYLAPQAPGSDSFSYTLSDGATSSTGTLDITISAASFSEPPPPDTTAPTIVTTSPASGATGVSSSASVSITFSKAMNEPSVQVSMATGQGPVTLPAGTWSTDATTVTFAPPVAGYTGHTLYSLTVSGTDNSANSLSGTNTFSFTTGAGPVQPLQAWISLPEYNAPYVAGTTFTLVFNDAVGQAMVDAINTNAVGGAAANVPGLSCHLDATLATQVDCTLTVALLPTTDPSNPNDYQLDIDGSVQSVDGWSFGGPGASWDFQTASAPATVVCVPPIVTASSPSDGSVTTPGYTSLQIWFSAPMDEFSVENALSIKINSTPVNLTLSSFTWWPNGQSVYATFANPTLYNGSFAWSLNSSGVPKDQNGCSMASTAAGYSHTFTSQKKVVLNVISSMTGELGGSDCSITPASNSGNPACYANWWQNSGAEFAVTFPLSLTGTTIVQALLQVHNASGYAHSASDNLVLRNVRPGVACQAPDYAEPPPVKSGDPGISIPLSFPSDGLMTFDVTAPLQYNFENTTVASGQAVTEWNFVWLHDGTLATDTSAFGFTCFGGANPTLTVTYY